MKLNGPEFTPKGKVRSAIIFLHGLGSNGRDMLGLADALSLILPNTAFLAPNAPFQTAFSAGGYQWFEYWDRTVQQMAGDIAHAVPMILEFIESTSQRFDIPYGKIILCGFSQGTMMSLHIGLRKVAGLGGIIGFSGMLMVPETLGLDKVAELPPVLLIHGLQDTVVPASASAQAQMAIKAQGGECKYIQRPGLAHSIDNEGIKAATDFCQKIFKKV